MHHDAAVGTVCDAEPALPPVRCLPCPGDRDRLPRGIRMSDAMSFAEVGEQYVELLPARTVLSLLPAGLPGVNGGDPGTADAKGTSISSFNLLGMLTAGGSSSGDTGGSASGSRG